MARVSNSDHRLSVELHRVSEKIVTWEKSLGERINRDSRLRKDFAFFSHVLGWREDVLLKRLMWDSGRYRSGGATMQPPLGSVIRALKSDAYFWRTLPARVRKIADAIEKVNDGPLSPLGVVNYSASYGQPLNRSEQRQLREDFAYLPDILRWWAQCVSRRTTLGLNSMKWDRKTHKELNQLAERGSLEVVIYTSSKQFHKDRLYRLYEAALSVSGDTIISSRAFALRLNKMKKRLPR